MFSEMSNYRLFYSKFVKILNIAILFGLTVEKNQNKSFFSWIKLFIQVLFRSFILSLCVMKLFLSAYLLNFRHKLTKRTTLTILLLANDLQGTTGFVLLWSWCCSKKLHKFLKSLSSLSNLRILTVQKDEKSFKRLTLYRNCLLILLLSSSAFLTLNLLLSFVWYDSQTGLNTLFSTNLFDDNKFIHFYYFTTNTIQFYFIVIYTVFITFSLTLNHEFRVLNNFCDNNSLTELEGLKLAFSYHLHLCDLVKIFNKMFKKFVFMAYLFCIPFTILVLYMLIKSQETVGIAKSADVNLTWSYFILQQGIEKTSIVLLAAEILVLTVLPAYINDTVRFYSIMRVYI